MDFGALYSHWPGGCEFQSCNPWVPEHAIGPPHNLVSTLLQCWQLVCNLHWPTKPQERMQLAPIHNRFVRDFQWCGIITFVGSWRVTSHIRPVLGQPDGYSTATAIATTGSNGAVGILIGYRHVKSHPSTMSFCPVMSYGSPGHRIMSYGSPGHRIKQASYIVHNQAYAWNW